MLKMLTDSSHGLLLMAMLLLLESPNGMGTNYVIPLNSNYTYNFQAEDQIRTYTYFPSTLLHKATSGFGAFNVHNRVVISLPYPVPDGEFTLLVGDWYKASHKCGKRRFLEAEAIMAKGAGNSKILEGVIGRFRVRNIRDVEKVEE